MHMSIKQIIIGHFNQKFHLLLSICFGNLYRKYDGLTIRFAIYLNIFQHSWASIWYKYASALMDISLLLILK